VEADDSCTAEQWTAAAPEPERGKATTSGSRFPNNGAAGQLHAAWPVAGALSRRECKG
jgi:hypothetical protein